MSRTTKLFTKPEAQYIQTERSWQEQYLQLLLTNTMDNVFYANSKELQDNSAMLHELAANEDPQFMAKAMVYARNNGYMRMQPIYGLVILSSVSPSLFEIIFDRIIITAGDLADFLYILNSSGRGQGGRMIKRACARFLNNMSEYTALKYAGKGRGFAIGDMVRAIHPKPIDAKQNMLFKYCRAKQIEDIQELQNLLPQIYAMEILKRNTDKDEQAIIIKSARLPHNIVTGVVKTDKQIWAALMYDLPLLALLRHLATLLREGLLDENLAWLENRLTDVRAISKAKILPQNFVKAYRAIKCDDSPIAKKVQAILSQAVERSLSNIPEIKGKTAILLDVSISMDGEFLQVASVFAFSLYKKTSGDTVFKLFDTQLHDPRPNMQEDILVQAERIRTIGGTDTGIGVRYLTTNNIAVDNIIIITDEQQNTGAAFYTCLKQYRHNVNRHVRTIVVDVAPYSKGMMPPANQLDSYVTGWSDSVLTYISNFSNGYQGFVEQVEAIELVKPAS